jgi:hypothetical protein
MKEEIPRIILHILKDFIGHLAIAPGTIHPQPLLIVIINAKDIPVIRTNSKLFISKRLEIV